MDTNLESMLNNLSLTIPQLIMMATSIAYVSGMYMMVVGIVDFKNLGTHQQQGQVKISEALTKLAIATCLIYIPSVIASVNATFNTEVSPLAYQVDNDSYHIIIQNAYLVMTLIGVVAVIKGLFSFNNHRDEGHFVKGVTFTIAGTLLVNLPAFLSVIGVTLGITLGQ